MLSTIMDFTHNNKKEKYEDSDHLSAYVSYQAKQLWTYKIYSIFPSWTSAEQLNRSKVVS